MWSLRDVKLKLELKTFESGLKSRCGQDGNYIVNLTFLTLLNRVHLYLS